MSEDAISDPSRTTKDGPLIGGYGPSAKPREIAATTLRAVRCPEILILSRRIEGKPFIVSYTIGEPGATRYTFSLTRCPWMRYCSRRIWYASLPGLVTSSPSQGRFATICASSMSLDACTVQNAEDGPVIGGYAVSVTTEDLPPAFASSMSRDAILSSSVEDTPFIVRLCYRRTRSHALPFSLTRLLLAMRYCSRRRRLLSQYNG